MTLTSPSVVVATSENKTDTGLAAFGVGDPMPIAPICTATACRGPMVTVKLPSNPIQNLKI
jgi:hypothetical protein